MNQNRQQQQQTNQLTDQQQKMAQVSPNYRGRRIALISLLAVQMVLSIILTILIVVVFSAAIAALNESSSDFEGLKNALVSFTARYNGSIKSIHLIRYSVIEFHLASC